MRSTSASKKNYVFVWIALLLLLALTYGLANVNLGPFNNVAALAISVTKMLLVVLFFMHGKYEKPITWIFICAGLIWFLIMVDLTLSDYMSRGGTSDIHQSWRHPEKNPPRVEPGGNEQRFGP